MSADIHKAGLLTIRNGRFLVCRKRKGTQLLILPGGKTEAGEAALECLKREIREELGPAVELCDATPLGNYSSPAAVAAGEPPRVVHIELFSGTLTGNPAPHAEIAELIWFGPEMDRALLAPSIERAILPDLLRRGLLDWKA